jgi:hypothetical protein
VRQWLPGRLLPIITVPLLSEPKFDADRIPPADVLRLNRSKITGYSSNSSENWISDVSLKKVPIGDEQHAMKYPAQK